MAFPNLKKIATTFVGFLFCHLAAMGQTLSSNLLNLNSGGVIYDIVEMPAINCYVVVGDFTHVNGVARNKVALVNRTYFTVSSICLLYTSDAADE